MANTDILTDQTFSDGIDKIIKTISDKGVGGGGGGTVLPDDTLDNDTFSEAISGENGLIETLNECYFGSSVDDELSETSENPVQNKVVTEAVNQLNQNLSNIVNSTDFLNGLRVDYSKLGKIVVLNFADSTTISNFNTTGWNTIGTIKYKPYFTIQAIGIDVGTYDKTWIAIDASGNLLIHGKMYPNASAGGSVTVRPRLVVTYFSGD